VALTALTLTLTPGVWLLYGQAVIGTAGSSRGETIVSISATNNTLQTTCMVNNPNSGNARSVFLAPRPRLISISVNTVYYLVCRADYSGAAPQVLSAVSLLEATRIA
jgi:hypothetical protein